MAWLDALADYEARDAVDVSGTIIERPLSDGTALVHANLHYRNLDFVVFTYESWVAMWVYDCDPHLLEIVVEDGHMDATGNYQFTIPAPGAALSDDNSEFIHVTLVGAGEGTLTGAGGFAPGPARVQLSEVMAPLGENSAHLDQWPVENINIIPLNQ
jgi:hypothetical protein